MEQVVSVGRSGPELRENVQTQGSDRKLELIGWDERTYMKLYLEEVDYGTQKKFQLFLNVKMHTHYL